MLSRFPFLVQARDIALTRIDAFVKVRSGFEATYTPGLIKPVSQVRFREQTPASGTRLECNIPATH